MSTARVLITDPSIPSPGYGSWSQRIEYLLQQYGPNKFDYLVTLKSSTGFASQRTRRYSCSQNTGRIINKIWPSVRYKEYGTAIDEILSKHDKVIICVIDSIRVKNAVWTFIKKKGAQHKVKLVYYQCGFTKHLTAREYDHFIGGINEMIYLTRNGYQYDLLHNPSMPFHVSVIHNPVNHLVYHPVTFQEKKALRQELQMGEGIQFIWTSHDRPKKGLEIILDAWSRFYHPSANSTLHVVGANRDFNYPGVVFHGRVNSAEMHRWYKASDIAIFSALWPEGFGLSLAEEISCGLLCIASTVGGVKEYFNEAEHGIAIEEPNIPQVWVDAFEKAMAMLPEFEKSKQMLKAAPPFLTYDAWCEKFQQVFDNIDKRWNG